MEKLPNAGSLIRAVERYLISEKQDKSALGSLIPGSLEQRYLEVLEALSGASGLKPELMEEILKEKNSHWDGPKFRIMLREWERTKDWKPMRDWWVKQTGQRLVDVPEPGFLKDMGVARKEESKLTSEVKPDWSVDEELERLYVGSLSLRQLHPAWRKKINWLRLDYRLSSALSSLLGWDAIDFDNDSFYEAIKRHQKEERGRLRLDILTVPQLEKVLNLRKENLKDDYLVTLLFSKRFARSLEELEGGEEARVERLEEMLAFLKRFPDEKFNAMRANVVYELLALGFAAGKFNKDLFLNYLKTPLGEVNAMNIQSKKYAWESSEQRNCLQRLKGRWRNEGSPQNQDKKMVRAYLEHFLMAGEKMATFLPFFTKSELTEIDKETRFQQGKEVAMEDWEYTRFEELARNVEILFVPGNPVCFAPNETVELRVRLKNVASLLLQVFEVNSENYYRRHLAPFRSDLNLEGLIPALQKVIEYKQTPQTRHEETFSFPELPRRGLFVVQFIGNGFSARAVIRKGSLALVTQPSLAGHTAYILDQEKRICRPEPSGSGSSTGLFFDGTFYAAETDGRIHVPFSASGPKSAKAVLSHSGLASLADFTRLGQNYQLEVAFVLSDEAFLVGNKAKLLIRPALFLNKQPADLRLLKNISVSVSSMSSLDSVPTTKRFENLESLSASNPELILEFQLPTRLDYLNLQFKAEVARGQGPPARLSSSFRREVNLKHQSSVHFVEAYLRNTEKKGYEIALLGKNGEPQSRLQVQVTLKHACFDQAKTVLVETDVRGTLQLGALDKIRSVCVYVPPVATRSELRRKWLIPSDQHSFILPKSVDLVQSQNLSLHVTCANSREDIAFFAVDRNNSPLQDLFGLVNYNTSPDGYKTLFLNNLRPGIYLLRLKESEDAVRIRVSEGRVWEDERYIMTQNVLRERLRPTLPLAIGALSVKANEVSLKVLNASQNTRVHVAAFNFMPYSLLRALQGFKKQLPEGRVELGEARFPQWKNFLLPCRKLSDEYRYVLDRAHLPPGAANFLEKPTLLLRRSELGATSFDSTGLAQGAQIEQHFEPPPPPAAYLASAPTAAGQSYGSLEQISEKVNWLQQFLALPAAQEFGLRPDKNGSLRLEIPSLQDYSTLIILAVDQERVAQRVQALARTTLQCRDLALRKPLETGKAYTEVRNAQGLAKHAGHTVDDVTSTELSMIDSVESVYSALKELGRMAGEGRGQLEDFSFLRGWHRLSAKEKASKFSAYGSHELNLFVKLKDRAFFESTVRPFLINKMEKSFIDYYLLDHSQALRRYAQLPLRETLNALELALLAAFLAKDKDPERAKAVAFLIARQADAYPEAASFRNKCFDCVLRLNELRRPEEDEFAQMLHQEMKAHPPPKPDQDRLSRGSGSVIRDQRDYISSDEEMDAGANFDNDVESIIAMEEQKNERVLSVRHRALSRSYGSDSQEEEMMNQEMLRAAPRMLARAAPRAAPRMAANRMVHANRARASGKPFRNNFNEQMKLKESQPQLRQVEEGTKQYSETHYYSFKGVPGLASKSLVRAHHFWADAALWASEHGGSFDGFLASSWVTMPGGLTAKAGVLALLDVSFVAGSHGLRAGEGRSLEIKAASNVILFVKEVRETESAPERTVTVVQRYFDLGQRAAEEPEEFLVNRAYGCEVILANVSAQGQECAVLVQIPSGALPLQRSQFQKSTPYTLGPYATARFDYSFYFPEAGLFSHFPATLSKLQRVVATARPRSLQVVESRQISKLDSFADVLASGREEAVLEFLREKNLEKGEQGFQFGHLHFLLQRKVFWQQVLAILRHRLIFNKGVWAFALVHQDVSATKELLSVSSEAKKQLGSFFESELASASRQDKRFLDFYPLVNARVHKVGADDKCNVLNREFRQTYVELIFALLEKRVLSDTDRLQFATYLLLQDRTHEAHQVYSRIDLAAFFKQQEADGPAGAPGCTLRLQVDYLRAYFDFLYGGESNFAVARQVAEKYEKCPVVSWRLLFFDIAQQLKEYDGIAAEDEEEEHPKRRVAKAEPRLEMEVDGSRLAFSSVLVGTATLKFYFVDLEVLFSRSPFLAAAEASELSFVQPALVVEHGPLNDSGKEPVKTHMDIPEALRKKNVVVEASGAGKKAFATYFSTSLAVSVLENYGELKVRTEEGERLAGVYVKVFGRFKSGKTSFYKDGYTDMRGNFDYASLSGAALSNIQRFSILVTHPRHGSLTKEAAPPASVATAPTTVIQQEENQIGDVVMSRQRAARYMKSSAWNA